jgi:hypothetical protein
MAVIGWAFIFVVVLLAVVASLWYPHRKVCQAARLVQAKQRFHIQRERLEAKFVQLAAAHIRPDCPHWADCTFADDVAYVRNRATGELSAFVAVTLAAEECGDDSSISGIGEAIGNLQAGTAVFRFDRDRWETDGRAILNLSPNEAIRYYRNDFEIVEEEMARPQR